MKIMKIPLLIVAGILSGCTHYYYVASTQNIPLFREKNECRISGGFGGGDESNCIEIQGAWSISDKLGITADYMTAWGGNASDYDYAKGYNVNGALGYYKPFSNNSVFEIYGGLGAGKQHHKYEDSYNGVSQGNSSLSHVIFFIRPAYGFTYDFLDIAVSARITSLSYTNISNNIYDNPTLYGELNSISGKSHFFLEPALTLRGGWKNFKVQFQAQYSRNIDNPRLYFGEEAHISIGAYFTIADRFKK